MTRCLQESRMREIHTSGLTVGSNGTGASRPLLSTLLVKSNNPPHNFGIRVETAFRKADSRLPE
jgi:hypothetical protein